MLRHLLPLIPDHYTYTEAYAGGLALFWAKQPATAEVVNDVDGEIVNFYRVLQQQPDELMKAIQCIIHSRAQYDDALIIYHYPHLFKPIDRAVAFWQLTSQGFAGKIGSWGYDFHGKEPQRISRKKLVDLTPYAQRIERTTIEQNDAVKVIMAHDKPDTFHYVDPPYIGSNQGHYSGYSDSDFEALLQCLSNVKGKFILSSYPSQLLNDFINQNGWHTEQFSKQLAAGKTGKGRKIEVVTMNYKA